MNECGNGEREDDVGGGSGGSEHSDFYKEVIVNEHNPESRHH